MENGAINIAARIAPYGSGNLGALVCEQYTGRKLAARISPGGSGNLSAATSGSDNGGGITFDGIFGGTPSSNYSTTFFGGSP
jgi:hypothetical protein